MPKQPDKARGSEIEEFKIDRSGVDVYPHKAYYHPGEELEITADLPDTTRAGFIAELAIRCLDETVAVLRQPIPQTVSSSGRPGPYSIPRPRLVFRWQAPKADMAGFGLDLRLLDEDGRTVIEGSGAVDVLADWTRAPRYGFLSDFFPEEVGEVSDSEARIAALNRYHINVVQFYDWMYRHHQFLPPEEIFVDPLGRRLSLATVRRRINQVHHYGMDALAYGAVYAAQPDFYREHPDWGLYKNNNEPFDLAKFINIMDPSGGSPWPDHLFAQYGEALDLGFDGIHMDQYGFPKDAFVKREGKRHLIRLAEVFPKLIDRARLRLQPETPSVKLIFNCVNNWPVSSVAGSSQDATYIEVWPPNDTYYDLKQLIRNARTLNPDKQVILAAYIAPLANPSPGGGEEGGEIAARLATAAIAASGGFHLVMGEGDGMLTDAYYPKYRRIRPEFAMIMRGYHDFIVRYENLLYDPALVDLSETHTGGINEEYQVEGCHASPKALPDSVWITAKEKPGYKVINLVNLAGIEDVFWNRAKTNPPRPVNHITVSLLVEEEVAGVYLASPERRHGRAQKVAYEFVSHARGNLLRFAIDELQYWDLVFIKTIS